MSGKWEKTGQPCPCGKSSDGYAIDKEGAGFCFSGQCGGTSFQNNKKRDLSNANTSSKFYSHRGISANTFQFYNVQTQFIEDEPYKVGFPYPPVDEVKVFKLRNLLVPKSEKGHFSSLGPIGKAGLFGMDKFPAGSKKSITITEGEYDAMAVHQVSDGFTAGVSITSSSSAKRDITADREYINSFKKIIFAFDNDAAGKKALQEVSAMFDPKKVFICSFGQYKDANEFLEKGKVKELYEAWTNAKKFVPAGIINRFSDIKGLLKQKGKTKLGTYPTESLERALRGFHAGEIIAVKGFSGEGKTEAFRFFEEHLIRTTDHPLGIIHLEENVATTIKAIATYHTQLPMLIEDQNFTDEEIYDAYYDAVKGDSDRVFFQSSAGDQNEQETFDNIRFLATSCDCKIIFFDHISWLAINSSGGEDERIVLDRIVSKFKDLAESLEICIVFISHVNDDGKTRGSRYVFAMSDTVIHVSRDKESEDEVERRTLKFLVQKARTAGAIEGPAGTVLFDLASNTLKERKPISAPLS